MWDYEEFYVLGHNGVYSGECHPTFRRNTGLHDVLSEKIQLFTLFLDYKVLLFNFLERKINLNVI
jgi:hypothetical protein